MIKKFNEFVNEDYNSIDEGLFSKKTVEDWWKTKRYSVSPEKGEFHTNAKYVDLINQKFNTSLPIERKREIEEQAKSDKFQGEIMFNTRNKEWVYRPGKKIQISSYHTSPPGAVGTMGK